MKKLILLLLLGTLSITAVEAKTKYLEKDYQALWCSANNGITEVVLPDKARVDCVLEDYAVEADWASKWAEGIGQSLYYAKVLNKKPAILLLMTNGEKDEKYLKRLRTVTEDLGIKVFVMRSMEVVNEEY